MILTFEEQLSTVTPDEALRRCVAALLSLGFRHPASPSEAGGAAPGSSHGPSMDAVLLRGSGWGNLLSFQMERLAQSVTVHCAPAVPGGAVVRLRYDVRTWGQFIGDADRAYFAAEARCVAQHAAGGELRCEELQLTRAQVRRGAWITLALAAAVGVAVAVAAGLLRRWG